MPGEHLARQEVEQHTVHRHAVADPASRAIDAAHHIHCTRMRTFAERFIGAARLKPAIYEEGEADKTATGQAMFVVALSSVASGIGLMGEGTGVILGTVAALLGWVIWAVLIYVLGAKVFPQPQTQVDIGELLRTTGFAASPGVLRVLGVVPGLGVLILLVVSVWMLVAMMIAVRQALDFTSTGRALMVCSAGWVIIIIMSFVIG